MAEVRCPMCNKMNPADAEVCRFCKTRLKPSRPVAGQEGERGSSSSMQSPGQGDGNAPDWLSRIRDRARRESGGPSDLFGRDSDKDEETDWLSSLQHSAEETGPVEDIGEDWLARLGGEPTAATPAASGGEEADLSSWLKGLGEESTAAPAPETPAPTDWSGLGSSFFEEPSEAEAPAGPAGEEEDWMKNLAAWQTGQPSEGQPSGEQAEELPFSFEPEKPSTLPSPEVPAPVGGDENLEWLRGLDAFRAEEEQEQPPASGSDFDASGFFASLESASGQPSDETSAPELPSWGDFNLQEAEPPPPAAQEEPGPAAQEEALPDWLSGFSAAPASEPPSEAAQESLPSWLSGEAEPGAPSLTGAEAAEEPALPDWLRGDQELPPAAAPAWEEPPPTSGEPLDWLSALNEPQTPAAEAPEEAETPEVSTTGVPDWLAGLGAGLAAQEAAAESAEPEPPPAGQPTGTTGPLPFIEESLPDWLGEFKSEEPVLPAAPELAPPGSAGPVDNQPFEVELPEWLSEEGVQEKAVPETDRQSALVEEAGGEPLAQAELPGWVQAMRPLESAIPGEAGLTDSDQRIEKAGPLAGMRGVLPAEESVLHYVKPPIYSVKLRLSEKQRSQVSLLDAVLARETQTKAQPQSRSQAPQMIQRVVVALFLLVILTAMVMLNIQVFEVPRLGPLAIENMYRQVDSLQAGDTVLLAVDYEPAFSGEMRFAAVQVMDHLMKKQARIAVVSTVPTGPALADELLRAAGAGNAGYSLAENVENLGYLPGGAISLLEFARSPARAAPGSRNGAPAWESSPVLTGMTQNGSASIQNFKRIIVLTDRAEVGRAWVEQVQPLLGSVPLLMVASAQAGPLLEPYVDSSQVQGMVSGLMGGALYGQWTGRNDPNTAPLRYWGAYQVGLLIAFVLVLAGGLFSGAAGLMKPASKPAAPRDSRPKATGPKGKA